MSPTVTANPLMQFLARRIDEDDTSYRSKMLDIAATLDDVIAMGKGDPDFRTPSHIAEAARQAIADDRTKYTHSAGMPQLRAAIAEHLGQEYSLNYQPNEVIVTAGVQEAIMLCMLALVNEGDEVLVPSPRFTSYDTAIALCGGVLVPVPTHERDQFALMPADVEARITPRTKILVLVTPNNPTGAVTPPAKIRELAEIAKRHNLIVLSDEIYAKIIFDESEHLSIGSLPGMKERTITVNGFSKQYAMTGYRIGYLAAPADFVEILVEPRHALSIAATTSSQWAALAALQGPQDECLRMLETYRERRTFLMKALDEIGFTYGYPSGAFYVYVNVERSGLAAPEFCERLLRECRIMVTPGTLFGDTDNRYMRMSLLQPVERMQEAMDRMMAAKERLFVHVR